MPFVKLKIQSSEFRVQTILHSKFCILNARGFTLIELMITMVIIGVVFGAVISATAGIQKQSRNAQRKTDLSKIQTALQQYYTDENKYPLKESLGAASTSIVGSISPLKTYLSPIPRDPRGGGVYYYEPRLSKSSGVSCTTASPGSCHYYFLCATLEGTFTDVCNGDAANGNYVLTPL